MPIGSKRYVSLTEKRDAKKFYLLEEALEVLKNYGVSVKFDETVEVTFKLGVDVKKLQQPVRGSVNLPHGSGKNIRVLVFAQGEHAEKAKTAGADHVGGVELIDTIKGGWLDFDAVVATPDMMKNIAVLGKVLGPRGLMPNPKMGTVTFEVDQIISDLKKGRIEFKMDKDGNLQMPVGKISFSKESLRDNINAAFRAVVAAKPQGAKGTYLKTMTLSSTMSPSVRINLAKFEEAKGSVS
jgi:large subunit ribosomal protein L1